MSWVEGIGGLFDLNRRRLQVRKQPESFAAWDRELRGALWGLARPRDAELGSPTLPKACKKVLRSLERHWEGLTVFLDHPEVAMDNNAAERALRGPVVGARTTTVRAVGGAPVWPRWCSRSCRPWSWGRSTRNAG